METVIFNWIPITTERINELRNPLTGQTTDVLASDDDGNMDIGTLMGENNKGTYSLYKQGLGRGFLNVTKFVRLENLHNKK